MRNLNNISKNKSSMVFNYEDIYCCFVFIVIYLKSVYSSFADQIYNIFLILFVLFIFLKLLNQKYTPTQLFSLLVLGSLSIFNAFISKDFSLLVALLFFFGMKDINVDRVLSTVLVAKISSFLYVLFSYILHFRSSSAILFNRTSKVVTRYSFGFGSPNTFHASFSFILFLIICKYYDRIKGIHIIGMLLSNEFIYFFSQSRTGRYSVLLVLICLFVMKSIRKIGVYFLNTVPYLPTIIFLFTVALSSILKGTKVYDVLNTMLSGRLFYNSAILELEHVPSLLGDNIMKYKYVTSEGYVYEMIHDNSYMATFALSGVIFMSLFLWYYYIVSRELLINKRYNLLFLFISIAVYAFMEDYIRYIYFDFLFFVCGSFFYNQLTLERNTE